MARNKLLVSEQVPFWAPGFQNLFVEDREIEVCALSNLEEVPGFVFPENRIVLWIHLETEIGLKNEQFSALNLRYPELMTCLVIPPHLKQLKSVFREIGALTVLDQSISLSEAGSLCRQLWKSCIIS